MEKKHLANTSSASTLYVQERVERPQAENLPVISGSANPITPSNKALNCLVSIPPIGGEQRLV